MTLTELVATFGRAKIGIDGNCGFALLGGDLQEGECEFVEAEGEHPSTEQLQSCAKHALGILRERLALPKLSYYTDDSFWG